MNPPPIPVAARKESKLAVLSLVLSCCSFVTPLFLGTIGGIVCGHLAMREIRRNPELEGRQLAKWGLIIGYSSIVLIPLLVFGFLALFGGICGGGLWSH
jgi:hypothetical protein